MAGSAHFGLLQRADQRLALRLTRPVGVVVATLLLASTAQAAEPTGKPVPVRAPTPARPATPARAAAPAPAPAPAASNPTVADAIALRQQGDLQGAARVLLALLDREPFLARAHHELGVLYAATGQWAAAEARLQQALQLEPGNAATAVVLADVLRANLRCLRALPLYRTAAAVADHRPAALRGLVLCHVAAAELSEADQAAAALQQWADAAGAKDDSAWAAAKRESIAALRTAESATALQMETQGRALFDAKRYDDAMPWLQWALDAEPTADRAYRLAIAAAAADRLDEAAAALQRALALDASHAPAKAALGPVYRALRVLGRGAPIEFATSSAPSEPGDAVDSADLQLTRALLDGDLLLARNLSAALLKSVKTGKPGLRLLLLSTETYLRDKQPARAGQYLRDAVSQSPLHDGVRKLQAELALQQGRTSDARELLKLPSLADIADEDLRLWSELRRQEFDHQLRMRLDPGLRALPPIADRLQEAIVQLRAARAAEAAAAAAEAEALAKAAAKPAKGKRAKRK